MRHDGKSASQPLALEPIIDLVVDLKVTIQSGQCILHANPSPESDDMKQKSRYVTAES